MPQKSVTMKLNNPISSLMTKDLTTISLETSVEQIKQLFSRRSIHHLLVEGKEGDLLGMVSTEDIKRIEAFYPNILSFQAKHIMTVSLTSLSPTMSIREALLIFLENKIRALPVVDDKGKLVGIVTPYDFLEKLLSNKER